MKLKRKKASPTIGKDLSEVGMNYLSNDQVVQLYQLHEEILGKKS